MKRFLAAFEATLFEVLGARELLSLAIVSVIFYAFYYPAPYSQQQALALPMVTVDQDQTPLSRAIVRGLGDNRSVKIIAEVPDLMAARQLVRDRQADGILYLSKGFEDSALAGRPGAGVAVIVNGTYFARAQGIARALGEVIADRAKRVATRIGIGEDRDPSALIRLQPLFNTTGGYRDYVFPAIANIILQQTLLFAAARLIAERRRRGLVRQGGNDAVGTWAALMLIGCFAGLFVFGFAFWIQDVPRAGNVPGLLLSLPLFAAAVSALGLWLGSLFRNGDDALKVLMPTSLPLAFLAGFAWPLDEMPDWIATLAWLSPATAAMHLFVRLNQMGASLAESSGPLMVMTALAIAYGMGWLWRARRRSVEAAPPAPAAETA
ncbi:ABC transporter permease [Nostoc sp. 3335mG]|nr:ABC transporter permease [Nostoc sp. 3335mG]